MSSHSLCCHNVTLPSGKAADSGTSLFAPLLRLHGMGSRSRDDSAAVQKNSRQTPFSRFSPGPEDAIDGVRCDGIKTALGKGLLFLYLLVQCAFRGIGAAEWHPGEMSCDSCHLAQEVNQANANQLVAGEAVLCQDCHQNAVDASHPVGVEPGFALPAEFPLNARGEITCSTCHRVHDRAQRKLRSGRDGQSFCESCHEQSFFSQMKDGGISLMALGHLDAGEPFGGNIDNFSIQCMACHEDLGDAAYRQAAGIDIGSEIAKTNHPIGRRYTEITRFGGYRSSTRLPEAILLPDGKLSCVSCHAGYSDSHGALVLENRADNLCYACHAL